MPDWVAHPRDRAWRTDAAPDAVLAFHRILPAYRPTRLVEVPDLARELGVGRVLVKDESDRLGLPAFKALGASWAMHRALAERGGGSGPGTAADPVTFVTATDGNHGRAVARIARLLGHHARILVPDGVHPSAIAAIEGEGAPVHHVPGTYDDAVAAAAADAATTGAILLQDTSLDGHPELDSVARWIVEGYSTLFREIEAEAGDPDLVVVPIGVGSLAQAAVAHHRSRSDPARSALLAVEPDAAACVLASLRAGHVVSVPTGETAMAGLNCGTPSALAWPLLKAGLDAAVAVSDADAGAAAPALLAAGLDPGPCGCAALAGAHAALTGPDAAARRAHLRVTPDATVVLLMTEGAAANPRR